MSTDLKYLNQLRDYFSKHHVIPSFAKVANLLGLKSSSSVAALAKRLAAEGYLESGPGGRLAPGPRFFEREILDSVRAGMPAAANQPLTETLAIDEYLIRTPSRTVLLTIKGDSMIDAGLMPGDTVVVERGAPAQQGDIVVAIVDNEFTVKYLELDKNRQFFLRPGNKAYPPIRPAESLEMYGKVVGVFRKYD